MKFRILTVLCWLAATVCAQEVFHTQTLERNIRTLRLRANNTETLMRPILLLDDQNTLEISFDELSHTGHAYSYTVQHCNADWTPSDLVTSDYLVGFPTADITDYQLSFNTTQLYTHYRFSLPNDDMQFKLSGNYVARIYEDGDIDGHTIATVCFCVVVPHVTVSANVRSNTDIEFNNRYQQLDIDINTNGYNIRDAFTELKVVVRQNERTDNQVILTQPTFTEKSRYRYINNKALIFEGGNEYRRFDIPSAYILSTGVDHIDFDRTFYHALLQPTINLAKSTYSSAFDSDGQFIINAERADDVDTEADYMWVHFFMPASAPFFDGQLYVGGDLNHNLLNSESRMTYDYDQKGYIYSKLLKQGGYDFQYWFLPKGQKTATTQRTEGSHWQTENDYTIYVYQRALGSRYDQLIGYQKITSTF